MTTGRNICNILKQIRQKIAEVNHIPYKIKECKFTGECRGTCPACENEVAYIMRQLELRRMAGKAVVITGLCASVLPMTSCQNTDILEDVSSPAVASVAPHQWMGEIEMQMPSFPGGQGELLNYLRQSVKYPEESRKKGVQGRVVVSFVVEKDGSITEPKVVKSVDSLLDAEALRIVSGMPRWTPGKSNGSLVRVKYNVPVSFRLEDDSVSTKSATVDKVSAKSPAVGKQ